MASPYNTAITSEGILKHILASLGAADVADRSRLGAYLGGAFGDYGAVPEGFQDKYGLVTPEIRQMAARNPFSFLKQVEREKKRAMGNMAANRAARGVVQSGGTALQAGDIEYDTGLKQYQGLRDLMSGVSGAYGDYADNVRGRFDEQTSAYGDTVSRLLEAGFSPGGVPRAGVKPRRPRRKTTWLGPKTSGPLLGVGQGSGPYIGTRP